MGRSGFVRQVKRLGVAGGCALGTLLVLWLSLLAYVHCGGMKEWRLLSGAWVTGEETRKLMRFHGTPVLKITQDRVYILRESRWVPVWKRPQGGKPPST